MKEKRWTREQADRHLIRASAILLVLFLFAIFIGLYISVMFSTRDAIMIISGIVIGTSFYYIAEKVLQKRFVPRYGKYKGLIQGATGEATVHEALKNNIDKGSLIISDVMLEENKGNIDHIVIGQHGVFAIETKTHRGRIVCDGDDWYQYRKIGEKTERIMLKQCPSIQARSNAGRLNTFLKQYYPNLPFTWVKAIVIFPNNLSEGYGIIRRHEPPDCAVFDSIDSMLKEIKKENVLNLTEEDLSQLENIFMPLAANVIRSGSSGKC